MSQAIQQTVNKIFEDMYFMFPEQIITPEDHFSLPMRCYIARTQFKKDKCALVIYAEDQLVNQMAMNFLGEKRAFENIELIDIFREAANVITGNYITASKKPPEVGFEIPVVDIITINSWDKVLSCHINRLYDIENHFFHITLVE